MKTAQSLMKIPFHMGTTLFLLTVFAIACAIATFIENDFGTMSAKALVYNAMWFEILLYLLAINMLGSMVKNRMWQKAKIPGLIFHLAFIIILIGAWITRYHGYEGIIHIREGAKQNEMISSDPYLQVTVAKGDGQYYFEAPKLFSSTAFGFNPFSYKIDVDGETLEVSYAGFQYSEQRGGFSTLHLNIRYLGEEQRIKLLGDMGRKGFPQNVRMKGATVSAEWGSKKLVLPFNLALDDFQLERYPGSNMPSSYASEVVVLDPKNSVEMPFRIYMNHVLDYGGYRFFQSSYDRDEKGTVLSVNNDPGKWPTYIGYFLLSLGLCMNFFNRRARFGRLGKFAKDNMASTAAFLLAVMLSFPVASHADTKLDSSSIDRAQQEQRLAAFFANYIERSKEHASKFGKLLVQDPGGRIKPMDTLSRDLLNKIGRSSTLYGMDPNQMVLGMMVYPNTWQDMKLIKISTPALKSKLNLDESEKRASFNDFFSGKGNDTEYRIYQDLQLAHEKRPAIRGKYDKDLIAVDERLNIAYSIFNSMLLQIIPKEGDNNQKWYSPIDAMEIFPEAEREEVRQIITAYVEGFSHGIETGDMRAADVALDKLIAYQQLRGAEVMPDPGRVSAEVFYNKAQIFKNVGYLYTLAGLFLFVYVLIRILGNSTKPSVISKIFYGLIVLFILVHTFGLGLRAYVSGHAPWSDAYESMVYIAWAAAAGTAIFFRQSLLVLSVGSLVAGITLVVAHLGFMDPQITNLVPVLKSYWLNIHVSVITASYGFFGLCAMLGLVALILFVLRSQKMVKNKNIDQSIYNITAINELSMVIGLVCLTIGNFLGGVWANESWGRYWGWDPKETWSLISIIIYSIVLHFRFIPKLDTPYVFAIASSVSFGTILMTYFGVNFYLSGLHSYASGDPVPIPNFVYYSVATLLAIILAAYPKSNLKPLPA